MSVVGASGTALITGISGHDGYYLSQLLQRNGFEVHGIVQQAATFGFDEVVKAMTSSDLGQEQDTCL